MTPTDISFRKRGYVRRERLVARLLDSQETAVVLIDAPAGFGKSSVLKEWDGVDDRPFAWLALGERHDDPVSLTASIAGAVADLLPVSEDVYAAFHGSRAGTLKVAVPRLLDSLQRSSDPLVLALDDVHALNDAESLAVVSAIAQGVPEGSQLALASRTRPSIKLSRLRANQALTELNAADLAMTDAEADDLLQACGLRLRADTVQILVERTEGWPAALYLAALSLTGVADADSAAQEFAGDDRMVSDYLRDEFLSSLGAEELDFLTRTSVLDELSGELCDSVLESEGSAEMLRALARSNALVHALDGKDRSFRYHALLRGMLESELHRLDPSEEAALHRRAGAWYAWRGDFDRAVPHVIATGDADAAGTLIWSQAADYGGAGRQATLERWLDNFSAPQIEGSPPLCLVRATLGLTTGNGAAVAHWTRQALALLEQAPRQDGEQLKVAAGAIAAAGAARDGVIRMRTDSEVAFEMLPDESAWRSICRLIEGTSRQLTGDREAARAALEDGARRGAMAAPSILALCLGQLTLLSLDEDDVADAARLGAEALARLEINALADQATMALVFAAGALVEARTGESSAASRHVGKATALLAELTEMSPWYEVETRIVIARARTMLDDVADARAQLADAGRHLRQVPDAPVLRAWLERAWKETEAATVSGRWPLTPAELRVLHYLPSHLTFREIAEELFVSTNTVKSQARSIYGKLEVTSRAEAVSRARGAGLLEVDPAAQTDRD